MGRSFDRGGTNRKERERGKRRAGQQAARDREARDAMMQAKQTVRLAAMTRKTSAAAAAPAATFTPAAPLVAAPAPTPVQVIQQKRPSLLSQVFQRLFRKSA